MLKLYKAGNSICTQKVLITMHEKGLECEKQDINLFAGEQYNPEYLKINPKGVVPSLVDDGKVVIESSLICEYLDAAFPEVSLIPESPHLQARMRLWSKMVDEQIFEATREITFSSHFRHKMKTMTEEEKQLRYQNVADPNRTARIKSTFEHGVESPYVYQSIAYFEKAFKQMEAELSDGRPWLIDGEYSLADINMIPYVWRMEYLNLLDLWITNRPNCQAWWERAKSRPSPVKIIHEGLSQEDIDSMWKYGSAIREDIAKLREQYLVDYKLK